MTPYEIVLQNYKLPKTLNGAPFVVHPLQVDAINTGALTPRLGVFMDTGTGKTLVETLLALYRAYVDGADSILVIMPPLLLGQWEAWLKLIRTVDDQPLDIVVYEGTPSQRKRIDLKADFVLVGIQIFKRDYQRFVDAFAGRRFHVAIDEASCVANIDSDNHEKVYNFSLGTSVHPMTGTPINNPMNGYGLLKFTNPGKYRSLKHFESMHVEERDFFNNPCKFQNLDLLRENVNQNSIRILFEDMYPDIEAPLFVRQPYHLDPEHLKLYRKLADDQVLALEEGGKIDATSANSLFHAMGQLIVNWGHFSGDPKKVSNALGMIEQRLEEASGKLVVFSNYRMSVALIQQHFAKRGAVAINGEISKANKRRAVERFVQDRKCGLMIINPRSGGFGLDGLQHVCHHMMFIEPVQQYAVFHQCVARLKRLGQRKRVVVSLPTALGTLQVRAFRALIENDTIVSKVIRTSSDLRAALRGE